VRRPRIPRRLARALAALSMAGAGTVALWPAPHAAADAPDRKGYWVEASQSSGTTQPTAPGQSPVQPSFIPEDGLFVSYSPEAGKSAISAVRFDVGDDRSGAIVLRVHDVSSAVATPTPPSDVTNTLDSLPATTTSTTTPPPQNTVAHLAACVTTSDWQATGAEEAGNWNERPSYATDRCVPGHFSPDGFILSFDIGDFLQKTPGVYDFAIVPDPAVSPLTPDTTTTSIDPNSSSPSVNPPNNTAFQISFEQPDPGTLQLEDLPDDEPPAIVDDTPPVDVTPALPSALPVTEGNFPAVSVSTTTTIPARPRLRLNRRVAAPAAVGFPGDGRAQRIMAVGLLMALGVAWWWVGGAEARSPKLLGSLGGKGDTAVPGDDRESRTGQKMGGIGRFARLRSGRPRRLL
jgi:hypothetical protein